MGTYARPFSKSGLNMDENADELVAFMQGKTIAEVNGNYTEFTDGSSFEVEYSSHDDCLIYHLQFFKED